MTSTLLIFRRIDPVRSYNTAALLNERNAIYDPRLKGRHAI